jgi:DNA-binding MarR family transcriptional regulator
VTLNIEAARTKLGQSGDLPGLDRPLVRDVLDELTSWNPREFVLAFQRWHHGALSLVHLNVLTLLEVEGSISMSELAQRLDVSVASVTGVVDRMEKRGLVERRRDANDRRVVLVHPGPGAKAVVGAVDERRRFGLAKLLTRLTDDELRGLLVGHRALHRARLEHAAARAADGSAAESQPST